MARQPCKPHGRRIRRLGSFVLCFDILLRCCFAETIAVRADASTVEQFAATELSRYLTQITGTSWTLTSSANVATPASGTVSLSVSAGMRAEEIEILAGPRGVTIRGGTPGALLSASYRYLHSLGCVFMSPAYGFYQGDFERIPRRRLDEMFSPALSISARSRLAWRKLYVEEGISHTSTTLRQMIDWMPKVGYNTLAVPMNYQGKGRVMWDNWRNDLTSEIQRRGLILEVGGHGYQNFISAKMPAELTPDSLPPIDRPHSSPTSHSSQLSSTGAPATLFSLHPGWFGQDEAGLRDPAPSRVFCTSNPAAVDYFTSAVLAYLRARPEIQVFDLWPPDSAKWCTCPACATLGSPADRQAILLNHVHDALAAALTGRDLRLEMIAYSAALDPPTRVRLSPDILVDFCPIDQSFDTQIYETTSPTNTKYAAALRQWRKHFPGEISLYSYYRKYAWKSLPVQLPHYMAADLRWFTGIGGNGVSTYCEPGDWATYELNHYTLARLGWNPDTDVEAIIDEFANARYGPIAPDAKAGLMALERNLRVCGSLPYVTTKTLAAITAAENEVTSAATKLINDRSLTTKNNYLRAKIRLAQLLRYGMYDLRIQRKRVAGIPYADDVQSMLTIFDHSDEFPWGTFLNYHATSWGSFVKKYAVSRLNEEKLPI